MNISRKTLVPTFCAVGLLFFVLWFLTKGKKVASPAASTSSIERQVRHGLYDRGDSPRSAVDYIDRRNPNVVILYSDEDSDGHPDQVSYAQMDGTRRIIFSVNKTEQATDRENMERFMDPVRFTTTDAPKVSFWVKSAQGVTLDNDYRNAVLTYKKLHPEVELPENEPQLQPVRATLVRNFGKWVNEYLAKTNDLRLGKMGRSGEVSAYQEYLAEKYMAAAYDKLNDREKDALFNWDFELTDTALQIGQRVGSYLMRGKKTWSYWPRNPRWEFEKSIYEPQEIDSMSGWSIFPEFEKLKKAYENDLRRRGLVIYRIYV